MLHLYERKYSHDDKASVQDDDCVDQQELKAETISKEEYFEWKIGWPYTCDECGNREPMKKWRKENAVLDSDES